MIDRRHFILGGACVASAASAAWLRPRDQLTLLGKAKLESITPTKFGEWKEAHVGQVVQPREEGTLAAKLYSQILGRVYENGRTGEAVMLAIAYGDTQSDLLQLHRPETCYPAFGFQLSQFQQAFISLPGGTRIPSRTVLASSDTRTERVTYWTRIGEYLPTSQSEQRVHKLRTALAGFIPDGILVRCSSLTDGPSNIELNKRFLADLVLAVAPEHRAAFVGTAIASRINAARV